MPVSSMNASHSSGPGAVFMLPPTYLGTRFFIRYRKWRWSKTGNIWLNWFPAGMYRAISSPKK